MTEVVNVDRLRFYWSTNLSRVSATCDLDLFGLMLARMS